MDSTSQNAQLKRTGDITEQRTGNTTEQRTRNTMEQRLPKRTFYLRDVPLLHCFISKSVYTGAGGVVDKESAAVQLAKPVYIIENQITEENIFKILSWLQVDPKTDAPRRIRETLLRYQKQWEVQTINEYIIPVVETANKHCGLDPSQEIPQEDRHAIWLKTFDTNPPLVVHSMFKDLVCWLDMENIFRREIQAHLNPEDQIKAKSARTMFRTKFVFACEMVYKLLYTKLDPNIDPTATLFTVWRAYTKTAAIPGHQVPIENLPIKHLVWWDKDTDISEQPSDGARDEEQAPLPYFQSPW